jgi:MoxR-like ATPase
MQLVRQVRIAEPVTRLVLQLLRATHPDTAEAPASVRKYVRYGASPRGAQAMVLAAKAWALLNGRYHVASEDVRRVAVPALNHRIILNFQAEMDRVAPSGVVGDVLAAFAE